jgi:hypothetical protein
LGRSSSQESDGMKNGYPPGVLCFLAQLF